MDDFDKFIESLEDDKLIVGKKSTAVTYPCGQCHGTGRYQGARVHQEKSHCFACRGTGSFKTDPRKLEDRKRKAALSKMEQRKAGLAAFKENHPTIWKVLRDDQDAHAITGRGDAFYWSLFNQLTSKGSLTDSQIAAMYRSIQRTEDRKVARAEEAVKLAVQGVDLAPIRAMFETALGNGYKRPIYRAEGLVIKRAPDSGRNPGALYITSADDDAYLGKVVGTTLHPMRDAKGKVEAAVKLIAEDPRAAAVRYGQRTGTCACCGRELTKHASIEIGIGPICAAKWGLA